jgi:hypothetical protein
MYTLLELPWWIVIPAGIIIAQVIEGFIPNRLTSVSIFVPLLVVGITLLPLFRHTVVELRYEHEKVPKTKAAKEWLSKAVWIVVGVILAGLGKVLWSYLEKHLNH